uniref:tRNA pseudouridine synthase n=1 Tax=Globodera pallida TaxID=36090 RepID=A0A183C525_GLOPA
MKQFDFGRYPKRRIALLFLYTGWDFDGLVVQTNTQNTVEETKLVESREGCEWTRCGRTDRGVSAFRQVAAVTVRSTDVSSVGHFWVEGSAEREDRTSSTVELPFVKMLNGVLPDSIRILAFAPVRRDFSARFNCVQREYTYIFPRANIREITGLNDACGRLCGTHDFRNFCHIDRNEGRLEMSYVRTIMDVRVEPLNDPSVIHCPSPSTPSDPFQLFKLTVKANGFLWHQIRCIVAVLWEIGCGNEDPRIIDELFDVHQFPARPQYKLANELPLCLFDCTFDEPIEWKFDKNALDSVIKVLQRKWAEHQIKAANIKSMLNGLGVVSADNQSVANGLDEFVRAEPPLKNYLPLRKRPRCEGLEERRRKAQLKRAKGLEVENSGRVADSD